MRRLLRLTVVTATALTALACATVASAGPTWTAISAPGQSNTTQVSVLRNADGSLTVAGRLKSSAAAVEADVVTIPIAANGTPGAAQVIASGTQWTILTSPAILPLSGQPTLIFGGSNPTYDGLWSHNLATGAQTPYTGSGTTATSGAGFASAGVTSAGGLATWSTTFGLASQPLASAAAPVQGMPLAGCCAYNANVVSTSGGQTWIVYDSNATSTVGLWAQPVDPATGAAAGAAVLAPKSLIDGGYSSPVETRSAVASVGASAYVAWAQNYPTTTRLALWKIGTAQPKLWSPGYTVGAVALTRAPNGALWLVWNKKYTGFMYARKSNAARTSWGPVISLGRARSNHETVYKVVADGMRGGGKLDVLISSARYVSSPTWYHALIAP